MVYCRTLKHYISLDLKLVKIHRILEFDLPTWLKPHLNFNTNLRSNANNNFEKNCSIKEQQFFWSDINYREKPCRY